ncbi:alpha/beta fold hydrolase [Microbispora bryophytorum]|uniref:alpha/beta hydrolase n=1 Tax=Microbispora bryophytorum TaxID=1460882 RepID=UPI003405F0ED
MGPCASKQGVAHAQRAGTPWVRAGPARLRCRPRLRRPASRIDSSAAAGAFCRLDAESSRGHFAGDLPAEEAALFAITQRPATGAALGEPAAGPQAWHTIPNYNLISGADRIIPPAAQEFMAQRSGATVQVVEGASHLVFVSHPGPTAAFIDRAARENT